jgi:hypothetical protein
MHLQICDKQYKSIAEMDEHLSSYDHHHKKRLKEMKQMELERTRDKRSRKEERRAAKEQERLAQQCEFNPFTCIRILRPECMASLIHSCCV